MKNYRRKEHRWIAIFLLGFLLFNYPVLFVFSRDTVVGGIPILYVYMFVAWAFVIGGMIFMVERKR